jgi:N4-gp56 family major capsid protein
MEEQKSAIDLRDGVRRTLMDWSMEDTRDQVISALGSFNGTAYADASESAKDAWLVDNADRVLFGATKSNNSSNDHSASLANIDNTNDKATPAALSLLKRIALSANPKIKPITVDGGKRYFVAFAGNRVFRDLRENSTMVQAQREVILKNQNLKIFEGGDLDWDGIVIHEVDDIPVYTGVGAGSIDVSPLYLCGAQAVGMGWAKRWTSVSKEFDYEDKHGVAIESIMGIEKLNFGSGSADTDDLKQHGVVTGYFAAVADA